MVRRLAKKFPFGKRAQVDYLVIARPQVAVAIYKMKEIPRLAPLARDDKMRLDIVRILSNKC